MQIIKIRDELWYPWCVTLYRILGFIVLYEGSISRWMRSSFFMYDSKWTIMQEGFILMENIIDKSYK